MKAFIISGHQDPAFMTRERWPRCFLWICLQDDWVLDSDVFKELASLLLLVIVALTTHDGCPLEGKPGGGGPSGSRMKSKRWGWLAQCHLWPLPTSPYESKLDQVFAVPRNVMLSLTAWFLSSDEGTPCQSFAYLFQLLPYFLFILPL